ncbi:unnamed protein product [Polarella glacialis]|uniref:Uncharacterized protein n=1 Tax=Polarella glacialis TaxID=89957 RepID=A0A813EF38_POLGL|nr:unnamed protein product [Polarella glacialis]
MHCMAIALEGNAHLDLVSMDLKSGSLRVCNNLDVSQCSQKQRPIQSDGKTMIKPVLPGGTPNPAGTQWEPARSRQRTHKSLRAIGLRDQAWSTSWSGVSCSNTACTVRACWRESRRATVNSHRKQLLLTRQAMPVDVMASSVTRWWGASEAMS